jgi:hypothetical protein
MVFATATDAGTAASAATAIHAPRDKFFMDDLLRPGREILVKQTGRWRIKRGDQRDPSPVASHVVDEQDERRDAISRAAEARCSCQFARLSGAGCSIDCGPIVARGSLIPGCA